MFDVRETMEISIEQIPVSQSAEGILRQDAELYARFFKVLGDPTRIRLLSALLDAPATGRAVSELVEITGQHQGRVSTHLGCLRWCGLVESERSGKQVFYRLTDPHVREILTLGGVVIRDHAAGVASCGIIR
jgi:DNA-binding transcriptional ArsR family regulator